MTVRAANRLGIAGKMAGEGSKRDGDGGRAVVRDPHMGEPPRGR